MRSKWVAVAVMALGISVKAWALGGALPSEGPSFPIPVHCSYFDESEQDPTAFPSRGECLKAHADCRKFCYSSAFECIAQGLRATGKVGVETGYSEYSEEDARHRATTYCIAGGMAGCQVKRCSEEKHQLSRPESP